MLIEFFSDVPLASLDNRVLEKFIIVTYGRTHSEAGLYYRTLKASFSKAVGWKYLNENPLKKVKMPKLPKAIPLFINSSELMKILEHTDNENLRDIFNLDFSR
jgi:site-specific recombinase XerD